MGKYGMWGSEAI